MSWQDGKPEDVEDNTEFGRWSPFVKRFHLSKFTPRGHELAGARKWPSHWDNFLNWFHRTDHRWRPGQFRTGHDHTLDPEDE